MRVIETGATDTTEEQPHGLLDRLNDLWKFGLSWEQDRQAKDDLIAELRKRLDNKYMLVTDVTLPGLEIPIPMVLVGPTGIQVIYASALKGVYRAKNDTWSVMDNRSHRFKPAQPNLIARTLLMTRAIETYLSGQGFHSDDVESVLFLSQPGIHVDSIRPTVRVVQVDGLDRYVSGVLQNRQELDQSEISQIAETLAEPAFDPSEMTASGADSPWQLHFSLAGLTLPRWQWLTLGVMGLIEICLMAGFLLIVFNNL